MGEAFIESWAVRTAVTLTFVAAIVLVGGAWIAAPPTSEPRTVVPPSALETYRDSDGVAALAPAVDPDAPAEWPEVHVAAPGETLGEIAQRYGVSAGDLAYANAVADPTRMRAGDVLMLPRPGQPAPQSPATAAADAPDLARLLEQTAREFGWRPATVKAVAWAESRWNHARVSRRGAVGVMQVRPATAEAMAAHLGRDLDPYDLEDNVVAGVAYLDWLHERHDGDIRRILAAYVQGPTSLEKRGKLPVTERYVARVLRWRDAFAGDR